MGSRQPSGGACLGRIVQYQTTAAMCGVMYKHRVYLCMCGGRSGGTVSGSLMHCASVFGPRGTSLGHLQMHAQIHHAHEQVHNRHHALHERVHRRHQALRLRLHELQRVGEGGEVRSWPPVPLRPPAADWCRGRPPDRCGAARNSNVQGTKLLLDARVKWDSKWYGLARGYWIPTLFSYRGRAVPWIPLAM